MKSLTKIIVLVAILVPLAAYGKKPEFKVRVARQVASSDVPKEKLVVDYFKCFQGAVSEAAIKMCVNKVVSSELSDSQRGRFYSWLVVFEARLAKFQQCSSLKLKEVAFFPEATGVYQCGLLEIGNSTKEVIFFFKEDSQGKDKLWSVYY